MDMTLSVPSDSSPDPPLLSLSQFKRRTWMISAYKFPLEAQAMPLNSPACFPITLKLLISWHNTLKAMLIALLAWGSASFGSWCSQVWPDEPLILVGACWWLWEMGFNDPNHPAQSTIYTYCEWNTRKKQFSLLFSSRILVAVKSENMRFMWI